MGTAKWAPPTGQILYFPHAAQQAQHLPLVLAHLKSWRAIADDLALILATVKDVEAHNVKLYAQIGSLWTPPETPAGAAAAAAGGSTPTLPAATSAAAAAAVVDSKPRKTAELQTQPGVHARTALAPLLPAIAQLAQHHAQQKDVLTHQIPARLQALRSTIAKTTKEIKGLLLAAYTPICDARSRLIREIEKYRAETDAAARFLRVKAHQQIHERGLAPDVPANPLTAPSATAAAGTRKAPHQDPWLLEGPLARHIAGAVQRENEFQRTLLGLFEKMRLSDAALFSEIKSILGLIMSTGDPSGANPAVQSFATSLAALDPSSAWMHLTEGYGIQNSDAWLEERSVDSIPFQFHRTDVIHQGLLMRPGTLVKRNWKPVLVVLTATGYLHCFNHKLTKDQHLQTFGSHKGKHIHEPDADVVETLARKALHEHTDDPEADDKPDLAWTLSLHQPRLSVAPLPDHDDAPLVFAVQEHTKRRVTVKHSPVPPAAATAAPAVPAASDGSPAGLTVPPPNGPDAPSPTGSLPPDVAAAPVAKSHVLRAQSAADLDRWIAAI
ncbi:hypothetical protein CAUPRSCDRAFT_11864, partial [Caulochytrium protostelioides]